MPVKKLVCDYCEKDVTPNTIGIDINHPSVSLTICARCLKKMFNLVHKWENKFNNVEWIDSLL